MVSFEESPDSLKANFAAMSAHAHGVLDSTVQLVDGRPIEDTLDAGAFDLEGLIAITSALVAKQGVHRIAIDGMDALFARTDDALHRRHELARVLNWLRESRITAILTIKDGGGARGLPGTFDMAEYVSDGVLHLRTKTEGELSRTATLDRRSTARPDARRRLPSRHHHARFRAPGDGQDNP